MLEVIAALGDGLNGPLSGAQKGFTSEAKVVLNF